MHRMHVVPVVRDEPAVVVRRWPVASRRGRCVGVTACAHDVALGRRSIVISIITIHRSTKDSRAGGMALTTHEQCVPAACGLWVCALCYSLN